MHYVIVGGSFGIGKALVNKLLDSGHKLTVLQRSEIQHENCTFKKVDVLDSIDTFPDISEPIDGIAYLPGTITLKPFKMLTEKDYRNDWELNFLGATKIIKKYLPNISSGSIVFMSSVAACCGMPYHASITAAKCAIEGFTRSLAAELAPKIRVNAVAPSLTDTRLGKNLLDSDTKKEHAKERNPLKKIGTPEEVADAISMLLSKEAAWITGQIIHVDGGFSSLKLI